MATTWTCPVPIASMRFWWAPTLHVPYQYQQRPPEADVRMALGKQPSAGMENGVDHDHRPDGPVDEQRTISAPTFRIFVTDLFLVGAR